MDPFSLFLSAAAKIAEIAPGVIAKILGKQTDEEALAHVRAVLSAHTPLAQRFHEAEEKRRLELEREDAERRARADEITTRTDLPKP